MRTSHSSDIGRGTRKTLTGLIAIALAAVLVAIASPVARADEDTVTALLEAAEQLDYAMELADSGNVTGAERQFLEFSDAWQDVEDGVRDSSRDKYIEIEDAMAGVRMALRADPFDQASLSEALVKLETEIDEFAANPGEGGGSSSGDSNATLSSLPHYIEQAIDAFEDGNAETAHHEMVEFRQEWVDVEGLIKAKSSADYDSIENDMARALSQLSADPADPAALTTLNRMLETLEPYAEGDLRYGVFDSAIILLREGFEALLIVGALLAFLKKINQEDKRKWVWAGSGAGVAASVVVAVIATTIFAGAKAAGANREVLEGVTGLVAAGMLIYMSYWLHTNASLSNWRRYIREKMQAALARDRLLSLSLIAFLAVFREGAETVLFYIGIAPATSTSDLLLGILIGLAGLTVIGVLVIIFGRRVPVRPFFSIASVLVLYMAFKFVGNGVHALQVAGTIRASTSDSLPTVSFFGIYPTWETTAAQLALAGLVVSLLVWRRLTPDVPAEERQQGNMAIDHATTARSDQPS